MDFRKSMRCFLPALAVWAWLVFTGQTVLVWAKENPDQAEGSLTDEDVFFEAEQLIRLNRSLKDAIEENRDLKNENDRMEAELKKMRAEWNLQANTTQAMPQKTDQLEKKIQDLTGLNTQQSQQIQELKTALEQKSKELEKRDRDRQQKIKELNQNGTSQTATSYETVSSSETTKKIPRNTQKLLVKVNRIYQQNDQLKKNSARMHYSLGNLFLGRGNYEKALLEYREVVTLMPDDALSHYQIAFISDEFLNDPKQALLHYERYLELNPQAEDSASVHEKIEKAKGRLRWKDQDPR